MDCVGDVCKMKPRCCSALPTAFDSIAEDAKNLLTTGFYFGQINLSAKSRHLPSVSLEEINTTSTASVNTLTGTSDASFEFKYTKTLRSLGLAFNNSAEWSSENVLSTTSEVSLIPRARAAPSWWRFFTGLSLGATGAFTPTNKNKTLQLKLGYKHAPVNASVDADLTPPKGNGPVVTETLILGYYNMVVGAQWTASPSGECCCCDEAGSMARVGPVALGNLGLALGWQNNDFGVHTFALNGGRELNTWLWQRLTTNTEFALKLGWNRQDRTSSFLAGLLYTFDAGRRTTVKATVNNVSQVGLAFSHVLRPGIKMTLSGRLECAGAFGGAVKTSGNQHQIGAGLEFEAF